MALTDDQKASVRYYLGWPDVNRMADLRLEGAMGSVSTQGVTQITALLASLAAVDENAVTVNSASRAGIIEVDNGGVKWSADGGSAGRAVRQQGRMYVARLAAILQIQPMRDVYATGAASVGVVGRG